MYSHAWKEACDLGTGYQSAEGDRWQSHHDTAAGVGRVSVGAAKVQAWRRLGTFQTCAGRTPVEANTPSAFGERFGELLGELDKVAVGGPALAGPCSEALESGTHRTCRRMRERPAGPGPDPIRLLSSPMESRRTSSATPVAFGAWAWKMGVEMDLCCIFAMANWLACCLCLCQFCACSSLHCCFLSFRPTNPSLIHWLFSLLSSLVSRLSSLFSLLDGEINSALACLQISYTYSTGSLVIRSDTPLLHTRSAFLPASEGRGRYPTLISTHLTAINIYFPSNINIAATHDALKAQRHQYHWLVEATR